MGTFWFVTLFVVVAFFYGWLSYRHGNAVSVIAVEAGPISSISSEWLKRQSFKAPKTLYKIDGEVIDSSQYIRLIVKGNCMSPRGIVDGTQLLALKVSKEELQDKLRQNDIVLIHLKDTDIYKIRIFDKYDDSGNLITYYYKNGEKHNSSKSHSLQDIQGIVKFSL